MRTADICAGTFLLLVGLLTFFHVIPAEISGHSDYGLPPDFFPRVLALLFIGLAALLVGQRLWAVRRGLPPTESTRSPMAAVDWGFIAGAAVFFTGVYLVMAHVGFIAAAMIAVALVGTLMTGLRPHPLKLAALAVTAPLAVYFAFRHLFMVFLPA